MLYFSRCPISAKILYLLEMFTSTVHNISHRPCTGTLQTYPRISALPSVRCPPRSAFLCIKRGSYNYGFRPQTADPRPTVQRSQHCPSGWNHLTGSTLRTVISFVFSICLMEYRSPFSALSASIAISTSVICLSIIAICLSVESGIFSN